VLFFALLTPGLIFYARNIKSVVVETMEEIFKNAPMVARITGTKRVVFGHTHRELHTAVDQVEVLNTGTWSPAFKDPECREAFGRKCFAWIRTPEQGGDRVSDLFVWNDPGLEKVPEKK
jgi:hypothetical protein